MRETLGYNKNHADRQEHDFYATPPNEVRNILYQEPLLGKSVLEPHCGVGNIAQTIKDMYPDMQITATDLIDRGYGFGGYDFLNDKYPFTKNYDNVIMNPPFKGIHKHVLKGYRIANKKLIVLARLQFMESNTRYKEIFSYTPFNKAYVYTGRIACIKNNDPDQRLASNMAFAWFVWDKTITLNGSRIEWIEPYENYVRDGVYDEISGR